MKHIPTIAAIFVALVISINAQEKPADEPAKIKELIAALGDDDPQTREAAQKSLIDLGKTSDAVFPAIQATLKASEDPEVKSRIGEIIKAIGDPEAKKEVLKVLDNLAKAEAYTFSCRVESPIRHNIVIGGGGPGGGEIAQKDVLTFEGKYHSSGISSMKVKNDNRIGWDNGQYIIYQIAQQAVFKQEEVVGLSGGVVFVSLGFGLSSEQLLHLDSRSWKLMEKNVIGQFLSEMTGETVAKSVVRTTREATNVKIDEKDCSVFNVTVDREKAKKLLAFGSSVMTVDNVRCQITVDAERRFPRRIVFDAQIAFGKTSLDDGAKGEYPLSVVWTFDDRKTDEKIDMPEEAKRLFLGDPAVRKILGSE